MNSFWGMVFLCLFVFCFMISICVLLNWSMYDHDMLWLCFFAYELLHGFLYCLSCLFVICFNAFVSMALLISLMSCSRVFFGFCFGLLWVPKASMGIVIPCFIYRLIESPSFWRERVFVWVKLLLVVGDSLVAPVNLWGVALQLFVCSPIQCW